MIWDLLISFTTMTCKLDILSSDIIHHSVLITVDEPYDGWYSP